LLQNLYNITHLTLGMLLRYLEKLKMQIFCRYSVHMEKCHMLDNNIQKVDTFLS